MLTRFKTLPAALLLSAAGLLAIAPEVKANITLPEWCRDSCSLETLESKELLRSNSVGDLYLATFSRIEYPTQDDPVGYLRERFVAPYGSELVERSSESYVFCSSSMPSILYVTEEREHILNRLALTGNRPSNADWHSHVKYLATCHNIAGPDFFSTNVANVLIREGYDFDVRSGNQMRVSNILEIMNPNATDL